jgi:2-octaprenylphenol hydroxylase
MTVAHYDVVIVGGGMVGGLLACALGNTPFKVCVIDQSASVPPPSDGYDLRVSAVSLASQTMFAAVGAWNGMRRRRVSPAERMHVWDGSGDGVIDFDAADMGETCLAYIIENSVIQAALVERLHQFTNVHHLSPVAVAEIGLGEAHAQVGLRDGRVLHTRLLVGADGAHSQVRDAAHIEAPTLNLRQTSIVATVRTEKPHRAIARQKFLATGPLAFLPLDAPHACSMVWSADTARAEELIGLDEGGFTRELQHAFGDALGAVHLAGARAAFPLALSNARRYCAERVVLIGDAAHTVHPLAGQGVNLGFLDAAALAEVLIAAQTRHQDIGSHAVLRRYERWRKGENLAMVSVTGAFRYVFSNRLPGLTALRNLGLSLTNTAGPIKNLLMRRASGLDGDLPRLARRVALDQ